MNLENYFSIYFRQIGVDVPFDEIKAFASLFQLRKYNKNDHLINSGENIPLMGFILEGLVRFYFINDEGKELNQTFHNEHSFIMNYYSAFYKNASPFYIQALENSKIYVGNYNDFEKFYNQHPVWDRVVRMMLIDNFMMKAQREHQFLMCDAKTRYENFFNFRPDVAKRLSQYQIAKYLGINPSSLNRIIKTHEKNILLASS